MPNAWRPVACTVFDSPSTRWTVQVLARMDAADPVPDVVRVPAGPDVDIGWSDLKPGESGADALPSFAPSFLRLSVLDADGSIVSRLVAAKAEGDSARALKVRLVEDLRGLGPAPGYAAAREWEGFVRLDTVSVALGSAGSGRQVDFYAFDGIDKAGQVGVASPSGYAVGDFAPGWSPAVTSWPTVHGVFSWLLYDWREDLGEPAETETGLAARPILYGLPFVPAFWPEPNGDRVPPGLAWVDQFAAFLQSSDEGVDPNGRNGSVWASDQKSVDLSLAAESVALGFFSRVFQDFDGWKVVGVPLIGEGTDGADDRAPYFARYGGVRADGHFGKPPAVTPATAGDGSANFAVPERRRRVEVRRYRGEGTSRVHFVEPVTRFTIETDRAVTVAEETLDLTNDFSLAVNPDVDFSERSDTGAVVGVQGWTPQDLTWDAADGVAYLTANGETFQEGIQIAGGGATDDDTGAGSVSGENGPQWFAARLVLSANGASDARLNVRLVPDDGTADLYAQADGTWAESPATGRKRGSRSSSRTRSRRRGRSTSG